MCGVWPYVIVLVLDALVHTLLLFSFGLSVQILIRLSLSFIFFIYPLYYVADVLWSLRPSVCGILSGEIAVNRKYYMNTVQKEIVRDELLPVTISTPIYLEDNEIVFQMLRESHAAVRRYREFSGKAANIVVSDDGLAPLLGGRCSAEAVDHVVRAFRENPTTLTPQESMAAQRILFYRKLGISFVARPAGGRVGLFKKASNLNYTLRLGKEISGGAVPEQLLGEEGSFALGYAEGDITTHEIILLLDKDSGVKERIIEAIVPEFAADEKLAYVQCATSAGNLYENYYTYATGQQLNSLFHTIWPCKALQGYFVPLVGHNVFLRKSLLEKSGLWSEDRVSEDYDKAICFYGMGYHGKYAQLHGLEFTETASRTFTEETGKQRRYAYGLFEMIFDGTVAPGKARGCDAFYMLLYFCSVVNQVLLLPTVLLESYFGNIHLLWAGFLICMACFILLPVARDLVMRRHRHGGSTVSFTRTFIVAVSFVGHSYSFLAGACRYLANKVMKNRNPFPSTNVDRLGYRVGEGAQLLLSYLRSNPMFLVIIFLCLDRGIFLLTRKGLEPVTAFTYCYILFCVVLVPVLLTPQLFADLGVRSAAIKRAEVNSLEKNRRKKRDTLRTQGTADRELSPIVIEREEAAAPDGSDVESFLAAYQETLQAALPEEGMPEELLSEYAFESCLRKDPESKKELYLLRRRQDGAKALLRITKDYPEEDALEEARLLERLDHPGIPKVYLSCEQGGKKYLVREYVEGRTLYEIVSGSGPLAAKDILGIALKLADILCYLHAQTPPVIHRDIKPQNIIVGEAGSIHLIDFGIARVHKQQRRQDTSVVLTLDYASPEQYGFEQTTPLSDLYSLGVVLLFLSTGRTVRTDLEAQIVNNRLRNLIEQCIAFNPKMRIQSAQAIRTYILQSGSQHALKRRRRIAAAATLLAAVTALSAAAYGTGFAAEKGGAEKLGYERGYGNGYTSGYEVASVADRGDWGVVLPEGSSFGNMAASGGSFAAGSDGLVFYIADGGIWRMSANGTDQELLVRDERAGALSFYNGWLYYSSGGRVLQTNIYTQESGVLYQGTPGVLYVTPKHFYLRTDDGLYRLNANTGEIASIGELSGCSALNIGEENLVFIRTGDQALYRCELNGSGLRRLVDGVCRSVCLVGDDLFCCMEKDGVKALVRIHSETGESELLLETDAALLNASENGLYYLDRADSLIYRCSFDGRVRERVSGNRASDFNIAEGWVFYHNEGDDGRLWCVRLDGANDHPTTYRR